MVIRLVIPFLLVIVMPVFAQHLLNGSFSQGDSEGKAANWIIASSSHGLYPRLDDHHYVSEPTSLCLPADSMVRQYITLEPGADYRFSCWFKAEDIVRREGYTGQYGGNCITVAVADASGEMVHWIGGSGYSYRGNTDWIYFEKVIQASQIPGGCRLLIGFSNASTALTSRAYFDDAKLEKITEGVGNVLFFPIDRQQQYYTVCAGTPGLVYLFFSGDGKRYSTDGMTLALELPEGFSLRGINHMRPPQFIYENRVETRFVQRLSPGQGNRYEVQVPRRLTELLVEHERSWLNGLYIIIDSEEASAGKKGDAVMELLSKEKVLLENRFSIEALSPLRLPERPAKILDVAIWRFWSQCIQDEKVNRTYLNFWRSLAEKRYTEAHYLDIYAERNPAVYEHFSFIAHDEGSGLSGLSMAALPKIAQLRKSGKVFPPFIDKNGQEDPVHVAPWYVIEDPEGLIWGQIQPEYYDNSFMKKHRQKIEIIADNFEPRVDNGYDQGNLERFARFAGLSVVPAREEVRTQYREQWKNFRFEQFDQRVRRFAAMVHEKYPGVRYACAAEPIRPGLLLHDIDPRSYDDALDIHFNMFYFTGVWYFDMLQVNKDSLKSPQLVFQDPTEYTPPFYERYNAHELKRSIIAAAAVGYQAMGYHPSDAFDGRYMQSIADGFDWVSRLEKYYSQQNSAFAFQLEAQNVIRHVLEEDGKTYELVSPDTGKFIRHTSHQAADQSRLITVFNFSDRHDMIFRLQVGLPDDREYRLIELGEQISYAGADIRQGALLQVPANATAFFQLSDSLVAEAEQRVVTQEELRRRIEVDMEKLAAADNFKTSSQGKSGITYSILPASSGNPMLKLQNGEGKVYLDFMNGGDIIGWSRETASADLLLAGEKRGFLGQLVFYDTTQDVKVPYPFVMEANGYDQDDNPFAVFSYLVPQYDNVGTLINPLKDLRCRKTITLKNEGRSVEFQFEFTNEAKDGRKIPLGFRIKNLPKPGASFLGSNTADLVAVTSLSFPSQPEKNILAGAPECLWFLCPGQSCPLAAEDSPGLHRDWQAEPVIITAARGGRMEVMKVSPVWRHFSGYLVWHSYSSYTVELLSKERVLAPGQKEYFSYTVE